MSWFARRYELWSCRGRVRRVEEEGVVNRVEFTTPTTTYRVKLGPVVGVGYNRREALCVVTKA